MEMEAKKMTDKERLEWIETYLFEKRWNAVIDSGSRTDWNVWGGHRNITRYMVGNTFLEAIDNAAKAIEEKSK